MKKTLENGGLNLVTGDMITKKSHPNPRMARAIAFARRKGESAVRVGNMVIVQPMS